MPRARYLSNNRTKLPCLTTNVHGEAKQLLTNNNKRKRSSFTGKQQVDFGCGASLCRIYNTTAKSRKLGSAQQQTFFGSDKLSGQNAAKERPSQPLKKFFPFQEQKSDPQANVYPINSRFRFSPCRSSPAD
jgi:hypothetical protein